MQLKNNRQAAAQRFIPEFPVLVRMAEKCDSTSHTGPQPKEASPMLATTIPGFRLTRLNSAAPGAMEPEPPTMALLG